MSKTLEYLKNNWRKIALIAGVVLLVVSTGAFFLLANMRDQSMANAPSAATNANTNAAAVSESAATKTYTDLYAVSIDNMVEARPASGINKAAFIYEAPVEGNITRFLAFFERGVATAQIGPVRSARLYFLDWIADWGAVKFFHFGGSPEALAHIAATPALAAADADGVTGAGGAFYARDATRNAPHNAYTSSDNVEKAFAGSAGGVGVKAWLMENDPDISARGADGQKIAPELSTDTAYDPVWIYSSATNLYTRTVKGQVEKDTDGAAVTAKNIIVISTGVSVIDAVGRLKVGTSGSGTAIIYRNGQSEDVTWNEAPANPSPPHFTASDGSPAVLTSGNVWIEVVKK